MRTPPGSIDRYTTSQRLNHWLTALLLILLALSGMSLFHPSLFFLTELFGGGPATRAIHPWFGSVLLISFGALFIRFFHHNLWNADDTAWLLKIDKVMANKEDEVPEVGRYNAGQKLVFWGMSLLILALFATGIVIWDQYFFAYTGIPAKRIAALVHSLCAVGIIGIFIAHVYAGIWVRGTMRGMMGGSVSAGWAFRHHRKWLRALARGR